MPDMPPIITIPVQPEGIDVHVGAPVDVQHPGIPVHNAAGPAVHPVVHPQETMALPGVGQDVPHTRQR